MSSVALLKTITKTISVTDAAEKLFDNLNPRTTHIKLHALSGNAAPIYFGDSTVKASTQVGDVLAANARDSLFADQLIGTNSIYVSGTAGDKICAVYLEIL